MKNVPKSQKLPEASQLKACGHNLAKFGIISVEAI
jgi:hypothetical protein